MIVRMTFALSLLAGCQGLADECVPPASMFRVEVRVDRNTCPYDIFSAAFGNQFPQVVVGEPTCTTRTKTGTGVMSVPGCTVAYEWTETFDDLGGVGSVVLTSTCSPSSATPSCDARLILIYHADPYSP